MINYDKPDSDPVVAEVRRAREELAAEFNYDLAALFAEMRRREATSGRTYSSPRERAASGATNIVPELH